MSKVYLVKIHPGKVKAHQLDLSNVALKALVLWLYLISHEWSLIINV